MDSESDRLQRLLSHDSSELKPLQLKQNSASAEKQLAEYKQNMRMFIKSVEKETALLIDKYETTIRQLKAEISRLKSELSHKSPVASQKQTTLNLKDVSSKKASLVKNSLQFGIESNISECLSPIKNRQDNLSAMNTVRSNFVDELPIRGMFGTQSHLFHNTDSKAPQFDFKFEVNNSPERLNKSRFEMDSKKKRQRQQDLLHYLEMGKSNLDLNTDKMFDLIGKSRKSEKNNEENQEEQEVESPLTKKRKNSDMHNTSLNSICDSLNNSFHAKKAQAKSLKKQKEKDSAKAEAMRREQEVQKVKKERGIKNLLTTMRKNISSSVDRQVEIVKASKLLTTGESKGKISPTKAKVMINPVPVDLTQRNKEKEQSSVTTNPSKQPQSILKNSSTNFLTKSIENISAISFHEE